MVMVSHTIWKDDFHIIIEGHDSIKVHEKCRLRYIRPGNTTEPKHKRLKVGNNSHDVEPVEVQAGFNFSEKCVICAKTIFRSTAASKCTREDTRKNIIGQQEIKDSSTLELSVRDEILDLLLNPDDPDANGKTIKYHQSCFKRHLCKQKHMKGTLFKESNSLWNRYFITWLKIQTRSSTLLIFESFWKKKICSYKRRRLFRAE